MATYLLAWNAKRRTWDKFETCWRALRDGQSASMMWEVGTLKRIQPGDRLFWIRLGEEPRGIFASGTAISDVQLVPPDHHAHTDKGHLQNVHSATSHSAVDHGSGTVAINGKTQTRKSQSSKAQRARVNHQVMVQFDVLLNPLREPILLRAELDVAPLADMHWNLQTAAANIPADTAGLLESRWQRFLHAHHPQWVTQP